MDATTRSTVRKYQAEPSDDLAHRVARMVARSLGEPQARKVVITDGYGGGWSTEASGPEAGALMSEYAPLVEAVQAGEELTYSHPAITGLAEALEAIGAEVPTCVRQAVHNGERFGSIPRSLTVVEVVGPYAVAEYDGFESIRTPEGMGFRH